MPVKNPIIDIITLRKCIVQIGGCTDGVVRPEDIFTIEAADGPVTLYIDAGSNDQGIV